LVPGRRFAVRITANLRTGTNNINALLRAYMEAAG